MEFMFYLEANVRSMKVKESKTIVLLRNLVPLQMKDEGNLIPTCTPSYDK